MYNVVVKLFNAVNKHQKELDTKLKAAPTEAKKAKGIEIFLNKVIKRHFCRVFTIQRVVHLNINDL